MPLIIFAAQQLDSMKAKQSKEKVSSRVSGKLNAAVIGYPDVEGERRCMLSMEKQKWKVVVGKSRSERSNRASEIVVVESRVQIAECMSVEVVMVCCRYMVVVKGPAPFVGRFVFVKGDRGLSRVGHRCHQSALSKPPSS